MIMIKVSLATQIIVNGRTTNMKPIITIVSYIPLNLSHLSDDDQGDFGHPDHH